MHRIQVHVGSNNASHHDLSAQVKTQKSNENNPVSSTSLQGRGAQSANKLQDESRSLAYVRRVRPFSPFFTTIVVLRGLLPSHCASGGFPFEQSIPPGAVRAPQSSTYAFQMLLHGEGMTPISTHTRVVIASKYRRANRPHRNPSHLYLRKCGQQTHSSCQNPPHTVV